MSYQLELRQPNFKSYKLITLFMAFINAVSFIFYFLKADTNFLKIVSIAGILTSAVLLYIVFIKFTKWKKAFKLVAFLLTLMAICWAAAGNFYFFILFLCLALFSFISLQPQVLKFDDDGINYPTFPVKFYNWAEVNQVLIKDDVLSIDLKNNKFLQFLLPETTVAKITTADFNSFCQQKISDTTSLP